MNSLFAPARGLRNPHLQGLLSRWPARIRAIKRAAGPMLAASRPLLLHGGEADLLGYYAAAPASRRLAVLLHGWEGSSESAYLLATASRLYAQGVNVLRLNLRDHGDSHHLNRELFHSCREAEVQKAIEAAVQRLQPESLVLAGYSLGGNFCLRLGTRFDPALPLREIIAVCPVLEPAATLQALEQGPWIYRQYFLRKWRQSLARKKALFPEQAATLEWQGQRTLTAMTDHFVRGHTRFDVLQDYLRGYAITGKRLADLRFPAHIVAAEDDPVIPARHLAELAPSSLLSILRLPHGGHCGFVSNWRLQGWIEEYVPQRLLRAFAVEQGRGASLSPL